MFCRFMVFSRVASKIKFFVEKPRLEILSMKLFMDMLCQISDKIIFKPKILG